MARVKKFHSLDKRPDRKRDFYGPLPNTELPPQAKKGGKKKTTNISIWDKA